MSKIKTCGSQLRVTSILIGSQFAIGAAAIFAKFALLGAGAIMVSALRLTIAAAILTLMHRSNKHEAVNRNHEWLFGFCGLALAVHFATWIASLNLTSVAIATLLVSTAPIWTTLYDTVFLRKRLSGQFWIGFVATIAGAVLSVMSKQIGGASHSTSEEMLGAFLSLLGGLAFACYLIAIRSVSESYSTITIVQRTYSWSAVFLWVGVLISQEQLPGADLTCWGGIVGMAIFSQLLGHTGINQSLKTFSPNIVAISTLLEPVFASILALAIFNEGLSLQMGVGAVLIVVGLVCVMSAKVQEPLVSGKILPEL